MIIFGTVRKNSLIGIGEFTCPGCLQHQQYRHVLSQEHFTIYFKPLMRIGSGDEFIQCEGCGEAFGTEMIHFDPVVYRQKAAIAYRQLSVLLLLHFDRCNATTTAALQEIVSDVTGIEINRQEIALDIQQAQAAAPNVKHFFFTLTSQFSASGKLALLECISRILKSEMPLREHELQQLRDLGKGIGLRLDHVNSMLNARSELS